MQATLFSWLHRVSSPGHFPRSIRGVSGEDRETSEGEVSVVGLLWLCCFLLGLCLTLCDPAGGKPPLTTAPPSSSTDAQEATASGGQSQALMANSRQCHCMLSEFCVMIGLPTTSI